MEINLDSAENEQILQTMGSEHPTMPRVVLEQALRFYRSGVIDSMASEHGRKKRGRKPKARVIPTEIVGAVKIVNPSDSDTSSKEEAY